MYQTARASFPPCRTRGSMRLAAAGLAAACWFGGSALAQEVDPRTIEFGMELYRDKAICSFCHGWAGDGHGDVHSPGAAPSLRITSLTPEQVYETIQCGRPATEMPHFDKFAYTDDRCYGLTAADLGADKPNIAQNTLQRREIQAIVDYLFARVVGHGEPTRQECITFFNDPQAGACEDLPDVDAAL